MMTDSTGHRVADPSASAAYDPPEMAKLYYHAGVETAPGVVAWSEQTRRTAERAAREAKKMARMLDGKPVVEYWRREHGIRPGDADAVLGCDYV